MEGRSRDVTGRVASRAASPKSLAANGGISTSSEKVPGNRNVTPASTPNKLANKVTGSPTGTYKPASLASSTGTYKAENLASPTVPHKPRSATERKNVYSPQRDGVRRSDSPTGGFRRGPDLINSGLTNDGVRSNLSSPEGSRDASALVLQHIQGIQAQVEEQARKLSQLRSQVDEQGTTLKHLRTHAFEQGSNSNKVKDSKSGFETRLKQNAARSNGMGANLRQVDQRLPQHGLSSSNSAQASDTLSNILETRMAKLEEAIWGMLDDDAGPPSWVQKEEDRLEKVAANMEQRLSKLENTLEEEKVQLPRRKARQAPAVSPVRAPEHYNIGDSPRSNIGDVVASNISTSVDEVKLRIARLALDVEGRRLERPGVCSNERTLNFYEEVVWRIAAEIDDDSERPPNGSKSIEARWQDVGEIAERLSKMVLGYKVELKNVDIDVDSYSLIAETRLSTLKEEVSELQKKTHGGDDDPLVRDLVEKINRFTSDKKHSLSYQATQEQLDCLETALTEIRLRNENVDVQEIRSDGTNTPPPTQQRSLPWE